MAKQGKPYSKDEKWVKEKGKPFHPHPIVWRRRGLGTTPAAQGIQPAAPGPAAAGPAAAAAAPAAAIAVNNPIVPIVLWFIAIIFLALNVPTGGFTLFLGFIVAVIGAYLAYKLRATDPKNPMVLFGLLMNCMAVGAVILVIITAPGPGPNPGGDCSAFGQAHSCTGICAQDGACHCQYAEAPVSTCSSDADCANQDTFCSSAGVCVWNTGGPAC